MIKRQKIMLKRVDARVWILLPATKNLPFYCRPVIVCGDRRHLREADRSLAQTAHWPSPPASFDSSSYVASHHSHYEVHFDTVCRASVLICPWIQRQAAGLPTTANKWSISLRCLCWRRTRDWLQVHIRYLWIGFDPSIGSFRPDAAVCRFHSRLRQWRDRNFSISLSAMQLSATSAATSK